VTADPCARHGPCAGSGRRPTAMFPAMSHPPSRRRTPRFRHLFRVGLIGLIGLGLCPAAGGAGAETLDPTGTWFVLIHYTDPETANPDATRWKDYVWVFEKKGSRLEWSQYPIVVFDEETGRFETLGNNPRSRVLAGWEPNEAQLRTLADGPQVNPRGKSVKTLRGSNARGWQSPRRMATASASVMGYQENLTIDGLDDLPRFIREDVIGNAISASKGGGTRYEVEQIENGGQQLRGRYERDGRQTGTFRMWRTPPSRGLPIKPEKEEGALPPGFDPADFE